MAFTRVKICGMTSPDDALAAVAAGADALGLVFYSKSPRAVDVVQAAEIAAAVPPFVTLVALLVDEPQAGVERILSHVPVDLLQFHGDESAADCARYQRPWIKALRIKPGVNISAACAAYGSARGLLLDSWQDGVPGGTGKTFDWQLARQSLSLPVVLAGGLNEGNVGDAIRTLRPAAVDVSGGVESSPGVKDAEKIGRFIAAVREADRQLED